MNIRKARAEELDKILELYEEGRRFMRAHGNMNQWVNGYPAKELLLEDIEKGRLFVAVADDTDKVFAKAEIEASEILCVFAYILGNDPTYEIIENGSWLNDDLYGTIHRLASSGKISKISEKIFDWALSQCENLRGDTHSDNFVMQGAAEEFGFKMCGIIHLENGDPRIAYHVTKKLREKVKNPEI